MAVHLNSNEFHANGKINQDYKNSKSVPLIHKYDKLKWCSSKNAVIVENRLIEDLCDLIM